MFSHFGSFWTNLIVLAIVLVAKYFLVGFIQKTAAYQTRMAQGQGWMAINNVVSGLNGLVTALLLVLFVGPAWAIFFGLLDFSIQWLTGYWKVKHRLPTVDAGNIATAQAWSKSALTWISALHIGGYVGMAASVAQFFMGGQGSAAGTLLGFLKNL